MNPNSVMMVVSEYPTTAGHTTVINNLCIELQKLGYRTGIGAFKFTKDPPHGTSKVVLNKMKLLFHGVEYLDYDIIHSHQTLVTYYLLIKKPSKPIIFHYHGASDRKQEINFKILMSFYKNRIAKILSVSHSGISQMKRLVKNIEAQVVYNGVNTKFFNTELSKPYKKGDPQLLFVSALRAYKRVDFLISAMPSILKIFPNTNLQIVGYGIEFQKLKEMIENKNLSNFVELTGRIDDEELRLRYSSCDIYLSASTFEVCPVPTLEAMSCGKPLILYDIPPHKEIIEISKAGMILSNFHYEELIKQITNVLKESNKYSSAARNFAKTIDWQEICKQISDIYKKVFQTGNYS